MGLAENNRLATFRLQKVLTISLVLFVMILVLVSFDYVKAKVRDQKRKADIHQIMSALNLYHDMHGYFPKVKDRDWSDWDLSKEPLGEEEYFLDVLNKEGFIDYVPKDPINDDYYHYRYVRYPAGKYECKKSFYILQISNFENYGEAQGTGSCPEMNFVDFAENGYTIQGFE
ncbi:MAG: hypothetical protein ABIA91_02105 [Patescibacteria group bacterium]